MMMMMPFRHHGFCMEYGAFFPLKITSERRSGGEAAPYFFPGYEGPLA